MSFSKIKLTTERILQLTACFNTRDTITVPAFCLQMGSNTDFS